MQRLLCPVSAPIPPQHPMSVFEKVYDRVPRASGGGPPCRPACSNEEGVLICLPHTRMRASGLATLASALQPLQGCVLGSGSCIATPLAPLIFHSDAASQLPEVRERNFSGKNRWLSGEPCREWGWDGARPRGWPGFCRLEAGLGRNQRGALGDLGRVLQTGEAGCRPGGGAGQDSQQ